jgi:hypothetical protein
VKKLFILIAFESIQGSRHGYPYISRERNGSSLMKIRAFLVSTATSLGIFGLMLAPLVTGGIYGKTGTTAAYTSAPPSGQIK